MAFMHLFCFAFSLRLGAVIIGTLALVSSSILLIFLLLNLEQTKFFSNKLKKMFNTNEFLHNFFENIHFFEELDLYIIGLSVFYLLMVVSCIILFIGAYQCKPSLIYQFLLFYIVYISLSCLYLLIFYLCLITEKDPLGTIFYFSMTFFLMLFWIYTWVCIYSLPQVIKEVQKRLVRQVKNPLKYHVKKVTS